jgi:hypothetical protein
MQFTGDMHEVLDLWEAADANAVPDVLGKLAVDPDVPPILERIRKVALKEELLICHKTPFSP